MQQNNPWTPWVWIKWKPGTSATAWEAWQKNDRIESAWSTHGDWDCVLMVKAQTPEELEEFVWKTLRKNEWVADTRTNWAKRWW